MKKFIIGKKIGMTQTFDEKGLVTAVSVIECTPNIIVQIKTKEKDGYDAVVVAFEEVKKNRINKPKAGVFKKANVAPKKYLREFHVEVPNEYKVGDAITVETFAIGDFVDVMGTSKGHGFSGTIKRWNFHRQSMTHGNSRSHRVPGSLGANTWPAHVFKNKKMPGQFGNDRVTIQNLVVSGIDKDKNCLLIRGGIPGANGALMSVKSAVKGGAHA